MFFCHPRLKIIPPVTFSFLCQSLIV